MKKSILYLISLLICTSSFSQSGTIRLNLGPSPAKQDPLISGTNIKTVNGQTLLASGDLVVTATPEPEADFYLSNTGNDGNSGLTKALPKKTLKSIDSLINTSSLTKVKVGIEGGSRWNEETALLLRANVTFSAYNRDKAGKYELPMFIGTTPNTTGWTLSGSNTYSKSIAHTISVGTGTLLNGYSWMYVIEVDTTLEKTAPLTARRYLRYVVSQAAVDTTVGSYYGDPVNPAASPSTIYIHTSDGNSPNNHAKYRYEVVTKSAVVRKELVYDTYGEPITVDGLAAIDFGNGVGAFASSLDSFTFSNSFQQAAGGIHFNVFGNFSTITGCGYVGGDRNIEGGQIVFYKHTGANETNTVQNSIFLSSQTAIFTHTSGYPAPNHGKLLVKNVSLFDVSNFAIQTADTDTLDVNYVYVDSVKHFVNNNSSLSLIRNSVVRRGIAFAYQSENAIIDNCLFRAQDYNKAYVFFGGAGTGDKIKLTNSIIHMKNLVPAGVESGDVFSNRGDTTSRLVSKHNIFIVDAPTGKHVNINSQNSQDGAGTNKDTLDYNAYIVVNGIPTWSNHDGSQKYYTLAGWQTASGQDQNSIFIDLRLYEGSLKRIFVDPDAGNYNLTNSPQADSIRAIMAGMRTPIGSWLPFPFREQILDMVTNKSIPLVSSLFSKAPGSDNYITVERMTTTQRNATYPSPGRHVYDTVTNKEYVGDGSTWNAMW